MASPLGTLLLILLFMGGILFVSWLFQARYSYPKSPYTGLPLRSAESLPFETKKRIYTYLQSFGGYENRPFLFRKAAFCRETGRIFIDCVDWKGSTHVDSTFLLKRHKGKWVSWGSLPEELKKKVKIRHTRIEGFQTERSSPEPSPLKLEPLYAYSKPGPLYVDLDQMCLLGWKIVPETTLEVLIVQQPDR